MLALAARSFARARAHSCAARLAPLPGGSRVHAQLAAAPRRFASGAGRRGKGSSGKKRRRKRSRPGALGPRASALGGAALAQPGFVVGSLVAANVVTFGAVFMSPRTRRAMSEHFVVTRESLRAGRLHTLLTANFLHLGPMHLGMNMLGLVMMGPTAVRIFGARRFLALYAGAGVAGNAASAWWYGEHAATVGASGAVLGTVAATLRVNPSASVRLWGIVPVRAWLALAGIIGWDLYCAWQEYTQPWMLEHGGRFTAHVGHLGGIAAGLGFYQRWGRRLGRF